MRPVQKVRCAIYTRKSSEDGLDQDFNSLDAQREACAAYIASQRHEGWVMVPARYDDGGLSGGTLARPALEALMDDVDAGRIDQIVVYKIDRLTRSLADFAKLVDRLEAVGASFVSVTQSFNTATSMGRLTLNVLLSFAQFEREVTAERIRDKIAASKRKGLWMGGNVPLGYQAEGRTLVIEPEEAEIVRTLFDLYRQHGSIRAVRERATKLGLRSKVRSTRHGSSGGIPFGSGHLQYLLSNPVYAGRIRHRGQVHAGQHPSIIQPEVWEAVQAQMTQRAAKPRGSRSCTASRSPLAGKLIDETGDRLTPSHANKRGRRYRYYVSSRLVRSMVGKPKEGWRLPAPALEDQIATAISAHLQTLGPASLATELTAEGYERLAQAMRDASEDPLALLQQARITQGSIEIQLDEGRLTQMLDIKHTSIPERACCFTRPFRQRKRGVETKLILSDAAAEPDPTLIRHFATARRWLDLIKTGQSFDDIAAVEEIPKRRVQQLFGLAFLAPDIVRTILDGQEPEGLTTDWLTRKPLPLDWQDQRSLVASL